MKPTIHNTSAYRKLGVNSFITRENGHVVKVSEHLLALLYAMDVQNVIVDFGSADTVPVFEDKDRGLVQKIREVGLQYSSKPSASLSIRVDWSDERLSLEKNGADLLMQTHIAYREFFDNKEQVRQYEIHPDSYLQLAQSKPYMRVPKSVLGALTKETPVGRWLRAAARTYYQVETDFSSMLQQEYMDRLSQFYLFKEDIVDQGAAVDCISEHTAVDRLGALALPANSFSVPARWKHLKVTCNRSNHEHDLKTLAALVAHDIIAYDV